MLTVELDQTTGIALLEPDGELSESDFANAAKIIDPYIEATGELNGIIIHVQSFPGWESFASLVQHLKFVKAHHSKVSHVAFVTDSPIAGFAESIAGHFVSAEVKAFEFKDLTAAKSWILGRED
tara:strand:+ start:448 stop:819 length:372 start_codon:yes stop_codon:yes gene_type:complete